MGKFACSDVENCRLLPTSSSPNGIALPVAISASVGVGGKNVRADVRRIQEALNAISADEGGAAGALVVDGWFGEKTGGAIRAFQTKQFPGWKPDVRIDPDQKTIARINTLLAAQQQPQQPLRLTIARDALSPELKKAFDCVPGVLRRIRTARRRVMAAQSALSGAPGSQLANADQKLVQWHFKTHRARDPQQHLREVIAIFDRMENVLFMETRPGSPFQLFMPTNGNPRENVAAAWAAVGGHSHGIQERQSDGELFHAIYIAPQFAEKVFAEMILLHELAHFCGGRFGSREVIGHRAHPSPPPHGRSLEDGTLNYARMTATDAKLNAQSYQFLCAPEHPLFAPPDPLPPDAR